MKSYNIISPTIDGLLSDDNLYFEGVSKPSKVYFIRDNGSADCRDVDVLEKYFNDIYNLFLRKISAFAAFDVVGNEDTIKIQALLQELIKVKKLILEVSETKYKNLL